MWCEACTDEPFTELAEVQVALFGDVFCDVHLCSEAAHTHVGWVWLDGSPALTAKTGEVKCTHSNDVIERSNHWVVCQPPSLPSTWAVVKSPIRKKSFSGLFIRLGLLEGWGGGGIGLGKNRRERGVGFK